MDQPSVGVEGHGGFTVLNRTVNPVLAWLLRSPLHGLASRRLALITFTGRSTGRRYTIPVGYRFAGDEVTITVGSPDRKLWWRNLTGRGAPVELVIRGRRLSGHAAATRQEQHAVVRVAVDPKGG